MRFEDKNSLRIKKNAFTLAEVLITLGIIGVVAAMTIPNLMTNIKAHKLRSQFLKSYSVAQQAFKRMQSDDVPMDIASYNPSVNGFFYRTYMKYFQGALDCRVHGHGKEPYPCLNYIGGTNRISYSNLLGEKITYTIFDDGQFALPDGSLFLFENMGNGDKIWVHVDINGFNNPPNRMGYDLFTFEFKDGELRTMGDKETEYNDPKALCNSTSKNYWNGFACAHRAKTETDYFKWVVKNIK